MNVSIRREGCWFVVTDHLVGWEYLFARDDSAWLWAQMLLSQPCG